MYTKKQEDILKNLKNWIRKSRGKWEFGRIGNYALVDFLGIGGMGVVFLGISESDGALLAVKTIDPLKMKAVELKRFKREISKMEQISHPQIIRILDHGTLHNKSQSEELPYLVMEYIPGRTLHQKLNKWGRLPQSEAVGIAQDLAKALASLHSNFQIIHRDLKPSNIIFHAFRPNSTKILDLGIAYDYSDETDRLTQTNGFPGTLAYVAPERLTNSQDVSIHWDIFSFGCVMYEMLVGKKPFDGEGPRLINQILNENPLTPKNVVFDIHPGLSELVLRMLDKNPEKRPGKCEDILASLKHIEEDILTSRTTIPSNWVSPTKLELSTITKLSFLGHSVSTNRMRGKVGFLFGLSKLSSLLGQVHFVLDDLIANFRTLNREIESDFPKLNRKPYRQIGINHVKASVEDILRLYNKEIQPSAQSLAQLPDESMLLKGITGLLKRFHDVALSNLQINSQSSYKEVSKRFRSIWTEAFITIKQLLEINRSVTNRQLNVIDLFSVCVEQTCI